MTRDDVMRMAREAGFKTGTLVYAHGNYGIPFVTPIATRTCLHELERFTALVAEAERQKHQADIERWKAEAATAEKWRGIACSKDGDGRTVQLIQQEAAAAEREACAQVCDSMHYEVDAYPAQCAAAIRTRGLCTIEHDYNTNEGKEK